MAIHEGNVDDDDDHNNNKNNNNDDDHNPLQFEKQNLFDNNNEKQKHEKIKFPFIKWNEF